jgi:dihydroorotate dehydrogenase (NAD+) catalytic subunit
MANLAVNIGKLKLKNPVMVASGTFGYAEEFSSFIDLKKVGAIVTKTITLRPRKGNPPPRTCETPAGMLNSIGLENPGFDAFVKEKLKLLKKTGVPLIVSIASESGASEFVELAKRIDRIKEAAAIELNISCPNIKNKVLISQDKDETYETVKAVRRVTEKVIITKLSPNVTEVTDIALAAQDAGSDGLALINTLSGMSVDIYSCKPKLAAISGGLSGPAIRPVAVRMVWECSNKINIPIIGMGGIIDTSSALEFIISGATCVSVGTGNFINPKLSLEIIDGIRQYLDKNRIGDVKKLIKSLKR